MSPLARRQLEAAATYFVVTFILTGAAALGGVDALDTHAVYAALVAAASGAVIATIKHTFPALTTLAVKEKE